MTDFLYLDPPGSIVFCFWCRCCSSNRFGDTENIALLPQWPCQKSSPRETASPSVVCVEGACDTFFIWWSRSSRDKAGYCVGIHHGRMEMMVTKILQNMSNWKVLWFHHSNRLQLVSQWICWSTWKSTETSSIKTQKTGRIIHHLRKVWKNFPIFRLSTMLLDEASNSLKILTADT